MPIQVTCPGCHQRFTVSDKFAGREGPCPKCKQNIRIPDKAEEVVIHAPEIGPKDTKGRPVLKPIARSETQLNAVQITLIVCAVLAFLAGAIAVRVIYPGADKPIFISIVGAIFLGPVVAFAAYTFLRDQERGAFTGEQLWVRVAICGALYAASWLLTYVGYYAFNSRWDFGAGITSVVAMLVIGGVIGMFSFELDYLSGLLHYGMFLGCSLILRALSGMAVVPGIQSVSPTPPAPESTAQNIGVAIDALLAWVNCWIQ